MIIWRINVHNRTGSKEPVPEHYEMLGGRGLIDQIALEEIPATCDPLNDPNSKLIFAPGLLVGHMLSSCDRLSLGGKSPLTGGIKESNSGGTTGMQIASLGIKAIIIEGLPADNRWWIIKVSKDSIEFLPAENLLGKGIYESAKELQATFGKKAAISVIGPGGEMQLLVAGIANLDKDSMPTRINARGGMGAVMGSKHIKAIVFDPQGGSKPPLVDPVAFKSAQKEYTDSLMAQPQTATYRDFGTAGIALMCNSMGALPTFGFSSGQFSMVEDISGENLHHLLTTRGGAANPSHACMPGCTIRCSNHMVDKDGVSLVSPLEYETIGLMGSNLGIGSLDLIAKLNWIVNDLGLDSIDMGAALGVCAQASLMEFGDAEQAEKLLLEIYTGSERGRILGCGAAATGSYYGIERVPVVKKQAISAYDPRAVKGTGVTYATSPMGADHTAGLTIRAKIDHLDPLIQKQVSLNAQINMAGYDTLGACIFAGSGFAAAPEVISKLLNARYGWTVGQSILQDLGRTTLRMELQFNRQAGFTRDDDRLPGWMTREGLPPTQAVFDVPSTELDSIFDNL